ncbi:unnamed protein product [Peniophora sp. CBMAI 1063]|nr:unnamed protein product [Peniophora sp. CBMAI 1063]
MVNVLIIGAAGRIGSVTAQACLERGHEVTAYVRSPSKLDPSIREKVRVVQGNAKEKEILKSAMGGQDTVIQAAVYGSNTPWGKSDSEDVVRAVVEAAKEVTAASGKSPRLWVLSGQVLMDLPYHPGWIEGDAIPVHPEHYPNYKLLREEAQELDWSLMCPAKIDEGEPAGPIVHAVDVIPLWIAPGILGKLPFIGPTLNAIYNVAQQKLTYKSVGVFLAEHVGAEEELHHKRVCILEDWKRMQ